MTKCKYNHLKISQNRFLWHMYEWTTSFFPAFSHSFPMKMENMVALDPLVHPHFLIIFPITIFHGFPMAISMGFHHVSWLFYGLIHGFCLKTLVFHRFSSPFSAFSMAESMIFHPFQPRGSRGSSGDSHWGHGSGGREHLGQGRHRILRRRAAALLRGDQRGLLGASGNAEGSNGFVVERRHFFVDVFMQCIMCIIEIIYIYVWYYNIYICICI